MARRLWSWLNAATVVQGLLSIGGATVLSAIASALLSVPEPWGYVLAAGLAFIFAGAILGVIGAIRQRRLPNRLEALIAKGMDELRPSMEELRETSPGSGTYAMRDQGLDEALDYYQEARQLLISFQRRAYLSDLAAAANAERRRSRDAAEKKVEQLNRRAEKGENVAAEQMDHFFRLDQRQALAFVDGTMEGLASIQNQLFKRQRLLFDDAQHRVTVAEAEEPR